MRTFSALPAVLALSVGLAGAAVAQTAPAPSGGAAAPGSAPLTTPPERLQGSTTTNNPATATTPSPTQPANNAVSTAPQNNPGAPVAGANSFTESEARARIERGGYAQVGALKLDSKGVWRGSASKDGKSLNVALDYQGNIVAE